MTREVVISNQYIDYKESLERIPDNFQCLVHKLKSGRNDLRVILIKDKLLVVKAYKKTTWFNRFIYAFFQKSKATRAYENSNHLIKLGISTPQPVAYINLYSKFLLTESYYICLFEDYQPLKDLLAQPLTVSEDGLKAFARFNYKLHKLGIYNNDFNLGNILYDEDGGSYDFSLIDNNSMSFSKYSKSKAYRNLQRLKLPLDKIAIISLEYAKVSESSSLSTLFAVITLWIQFHIRCRAKGILKSIQNVSCKAILEWME